jgi:hypothetical protein
LFSQPLLDSSFLSPLSLSFSLCVQQHTPAHTLCLYLSRGHISSPAMEAHVYAVYMHVCMHVCVRACVRRVYDIYIHTRAHLLYICISKWVCINIYIYIIRIYIIILHRLLREEDAVRRKMRWQAALHSRSTAILRRHAFRLYLFPSQSPTPLCISAIISLSPPRPPAPSPVAPSPPVHPKRSSVRVYYFSFAFPLRCSSRSASRSSCLL